MDSLVLLSIKLVANQNRYCCTPFVTYIQKGKTNQLGGRCTKVIGLYFARSKHIRGIDSNYTNVLLVIKGNTPIIGQLYKCSSTGVENTTYLRKK